MKLPLLAAAFLFIAAPQAQAVTAEALYRSCVKGGEMGSDGSVGWAFCAGFLRGAIDTWRVERELDGEDRFCLPETGIGMEDALTAFAALYGEAERTHAMPAAIVLLLALRGAYPCAEE